MLTAIVFVIAIITATHAQQACQLTEPDILGPYYVPGAPRAQQQLCANTEAHDRLILTGQVVDYDSGCTRAIPNVQLDLWQANSNGVYSAGKNAQDWFCRGIFVTDANGKFLITTILPGRYDDGGFRPAHIHFNITAAGYPKLVTQLYFKDDYYLSPQDSCDPCNSEASSLQLDTAQPNDLKTFEGDWTIALSKTPRTPVRPMARISSIRGSYLTIKEHIMHNHSIIFICLRTKILLLVFHCFCSFMLQLQILLLTVIGTFGIHFAALEDNDTLGTFLI